MKRVLFLTSLVLVILVAMTGVALAAKYDSTYTLPTATSPHGNWTVNTIKCNVCHAVHNPGDPAEAVGTAPDDRDMTGPSVAARGADSQYLLRADGGGACLYCHVSDTFAIKTVYAEDTDKYNGLDAIGEDAKAHDLAGAAWDGCIDCHQVHAAANLVVSEDSYLANKLLMEQPAYDTNAPAFSDETGNKIRDNATRLNQTTWCTGCHLYYQSAAVGTLGADTHTMKAAAGSGYVASSYCDSCHDSGNVNQLAATDGANNFPHYTDGARFLRVGANAAGTTGEAAADGNGQVPVDGACLKCHVNAAGDAGIGFTH